MNRDRPIRTLILKPAFLLLFAALNLLIGADIGSRVIMIGAGVGGIACLCALLGRARLDHRLAKAGVETSRQAAGLHRVLRILGAAAIILVAAYAEWVVLHVALDPWIDPPPGPVRGQIRVTGVDFGKGVTWYPDLCRPAINPGVTAAALMSKDDRFPLAWVIGRPGNGLAAIDVQRGAASTTVRFFPADCSRFHGDVQSVRTGAGAMGSLIGFADAECVHGGDTLTMHVDFNACKAMPSSPASASPSARTTSAQ